MGGPADLAMSLALGTIIIVLGIGYAALFWGSMVGELMAMAALVGGDPLLAGLGGVCLGLKVMVVGIRSWLDRER